MQDLRGTVRINPLAIHKSEAAMIHAPKAKHSPQAGEAVVIHLEGEFDLSERDRLRDAFASIGDAPLVIVDFEKVAYIDSVVLECLVGLHGAIEKRNGRMVLLGVGGSVMRLLEVTSLDRIFEIHKNLGDLGLDTTQLQTLTIEACNLNAE